MGIALLGSVLTAVYRVALPADAPEAARDSLAAASAALDASSPALEEAREAFVTAMQTTTGIAAAVMLAGAVVAFLLVPSERRAPADSVA